MQLHVALTDEQLARFQNQVAVLGQAKARIAFSRAVNRVTRSLKTRVIRALVRDGFPRKIVTRSVGMSLSSQKGDGPISGVVYATGAPVSLKYFQARQFSFGVRAKVLGDVRRYPSAFINAGRWNSGNPVANGHVFERAGRSRFPIVKLEGPSVPERLVEGETAKAFADLSQTMLPARVSHELGRLLGI